MTRLDEFVADDRYTQFGEAGCLAHILDQIGTVSRVAVEFGAADGVSCSNTAQLWRDSGWKALLVESDPKCFELLEGNARLFDTTCLCTHVTPTGPNSISALMGTQDIDEVDVLSIDIDGDDYYILRELEARPRVIIIEFNPTVPPHIELRQQPGGTFGASLLAIVRLAESIGYTFVGATYCNAFLVLAEEAAPFSNYETDLDALVDPNCFTYAVTDFGGRIVLAGQIPPWGTRDPYVLPLEGSTYVTPPSDSPQLARRGFESIWGPADWVNPNGLSQERLEEMLTQRPTLVCIDLTSVVDHEWMVAEAHRNNYRTVIFGRVLGLIDRSRDE